MIAPVQSLSHLKSKSKLDVNYKTLSLTAANKMGGEVETLDEALTYFKELLDNEDEDDIVQEINSFRGEL
jgi:hypothetical protein